MSLELHPQQDKRYTRIRVHNDDDFQRLYPLILDYIREPELALSVKEFVFRCHLPHSLISMIGQAQLDALHAAENARDISQEHSIFQKVTDLGIEGLERSRWVRALTWMKPGLVAARTGGFDVGAFYNHYNKIFAHHAAALLLLLCPNIEVLKYEQGSTVVEDILCRNNYGLLPSQYLQKLRDVTLLPTDNFILGDTRFYVNMDILAMLRLFHRLPAIESVSVDAVGPHFDAGYISHFPPATSNLKRIYVGHSMHGTDVIGTLIGVPKRLEEFTFTTGGRASSDGGYALTFAETIGKALYSHKSSLRKIDLDIDEHIIGKESFYDDEDDDEYDSEEEDKDEWYERDMEISTAPAQAENTREYGGTIGSMHDFESLTHLSIGIKVLLGGSSPDSNVADAPFRLAEALPKSLEYLLIRGYERGKVAQYDAKIDEFLASKQDHFPVLKEVHGIDKTIPSAVSIRSPDESYDQLWRPEISDEEWMEAPGSTGSEER
ncbi:hypothetical protein F5Y01DRAFT_268809 [Xylaria sp. FL0043]|nr:hypothetical protein F5Y01DRAFT_268809 [Xylaria sp. FL0043]